MPTVKSLEDLKRIREEALQKREIKSTPGSIQIIVGMGTPGIAAGARFIVTPAFRPDVIVACREAQVPIFSGALTPTEILNTWDAGADAVKVFPAEFFGPAYIKSVRAPFPNISLVPTGGVNAENVGEFIKAGAYATAAGSSLVDAKTLKEKNWAVITARAKAFVAAVAAVK